MVAYHYIGGGSWLPDLPARDITEDELVEHPEWAERLDGAPALYASADEDGEE